MTGTSNAALAVLLPVNRATMDGAPVQTVDARKLHAWLGVGRDYSTWIRERIATYGLVPDVDYIEPDFSPDPGKNARGRPALEIHVTIDAAKQLSMVDGGPRGAEVRRYFLACERAARTGALGRLAGLGPDPARTIGGVVRGVVGKQMAEAETRTVTCLAEVIHAEVAALEARIMEAMRRSPGADADQVAAPVAGAPATYLTALDVVFLVTPSPPHARSLAQIASAGLRKYALARGEPVRRHASGRHQFAAASVQDWLAHGGLARLREAAR